eukprot:m.50385 g.50385  ORF g.50385 m.50385 type:complete len:382 (-) comp15374_c1_seq2:965-2110(-)
MLQGKKCKAIVNNMSPRRNNFADDDSYGSCGRGAGTCFICLGTFILIFSAIRIVGPGLKGMDMDETTCNVTRIDIGADDSFSCDCGGFCSGTAPCVKIYVHIEAEGETAEDQMVHTTLTSLHHFSQCSWDNRECGSRHFENNIASAENWVEENYDEGEAYTCWYDPDNPGDVVFEREFDVRKIVNALLWPILFFFIGCCLLCVNSKGIRQCGGACCVAIVLPFWCLFYEGPRRMYKAMQRKCGCGGTDVFDDQSTDGAEAGCCESLCCPRSLRVHMVFSQGAIFPTDNNSTRGTDGCFFFSKRAISMAGNVFLDLSRNGLLAFCSWGAFCRVLTMSHGAVDVALQTPCCRDKSHSTAPTFRQRTTTLSATRLCLPPLNCSI